MSRNEAPDKPTELSKPSVVAALKRAAKEFQRDNLTDWAAALTYYAVLAIFPALLVLVAILGLFGSDTTTKLLNEVGDVAPGGARSFVEQMISNIQEQQAAAGAMAIIGVLIALWSASGYIGGFMNASNIVYDVQEGRPIWKKLPTRVLVTLAVVIMLVVSALIVILSGSVATAVGNALGLGDTTVLIWNIAKWPLLIVIADVIVAVMYWACPNVRPTSFKWISPGSILSIIVWLAASGGFAIYVANFSSYNKTYGSIAGVIIFLVWLWISNLALLLGAELNAELERARAIEAGLPADAEPYVDVRDTKKMDPKEREQAEATSRQLDSTN